MNQLDILETPSEAASRNAQIGSQWASAFLGAYNASTARRREDERWAEGKPLRDAQLATENAQLDGLVAQNKLRSIALANQSAMQAKMADFAGLSGDIAAKGWEPTDKGKLYEFLRKNPEFYGSPFHQQLEAGFTNAQKARDDEERWRTELGTKIAVERIQQESRELGAPKSKLTPEQQRALSHELTTIRNSVMAVDPEWTKRETEKVYQKFGVSQTDVSQPSGQDTQAQQPPENGPTKTSGAIKVVRTPQGFAREGERRQASQVSGNDARLPTRSWLETIWGASEPSEPMF